jgi:hypothetical protein
MVISPIQAGQVYDEIRPGNKLIQLIARGKCCAVARQHTDVGATVQETANMPTD